MFAFSPPCGGGLSGCGRLTALAPSSAFPLVRPPPASLLSSFHRPSRGLPATSQTSLAAAEIIGWKGTGVLLYTDVQYALVINSVLGLLLLATGKYKSVLTTSGLLSAWLLGVILWGSLGMAGWSTCVFYLIAGSLATKVKMAEKESKGIAENRGGARGPENVWGSAATAAFCAMMATFSLQDTGLFKIGFVASLATKLSDTFASELGKAYGKKTFLITSLKPVPAGTEGAVSLEGTLAGVVGSLVLAVWAVIANVMLPSEIPVVMIAAFVATTCESFIGATAQSKYKWLTNEAVNAINTSIGAAVGIFLFSLYH